MLLGRRGEHVVEEVEEGRSRPGGRPRRRRRAAGDGEGLEEPAERPRTPPGGKRPGPRPMIDATRSTVSSAAGSSGERRRELLACASSGESSSMMPAAPRASSTSGQKVMPSPYGRQRPCSTVAVAARRRESVDETRLAHARVAEDHDAGGTRPRGDGRRPRRAARARALARPSGVGRGARSAWPRSTPSQTVRGHRLRLALQRSGSTASATTARGRGDRSRRR